MLCRADLGTGRVTGELIKRNDQTILMRLVGNAPKEKNTQTVPQKKIHRPVNHRIIPLLMISEVIAGIPNEPNVNHYVPERKKGKLIKRHIVKHRVTFGGKDEG